MYKVVISKSASKELEVLPERIILKIRDTVLQLAFNPRPIGCKKLKGFKDLYRLRVGAYRIIYSITDNILFIEILKIADRKDVYR